MKILYCNTPALNQRVSEINTGAKELQKVIDEFLKLNITNIKDISELPDLIKDPETFIKRKLEASMDVEASKIGSLLKSITGIGVSKRKLVDLLDLPDLQQLKELCEYERKKSTDLRHLSFDGKRIFISPEEMENLKEIYSVCASNPKQENVLKAHIGAAKAIQELEKACREIGISDLEQLSINRLFKFEPDQVSIQDYFYKDRSHAFPRN